MFKPSMFDNNKNAEDEGSDDQAEVPEEAPIYAEANEKVVMKTGVQIQKSPYTKIFAVSS